MKNRGFTLIELLVVIAVLGVLAAGVFVAINPLKRINQANDARIKSDIGQIAQSSQAYFTQKLSYPRTVAQLVANGDLKTAPKQPGTNADYGITPTPSTCDGTSANPCTDIIIEGVLAAPQTPSATYQWNSTTNIAGEVTVPTSTPIPSATPTITPTPLPPIVLSDDNQTGFWQSYGDQNPGGEKVWQFSLTNDTATKQSGTNSLKIVTAPGSNSHPYLYHDYGGSNTQNWSTRNTVTFNWYGTNTNVALSFQIQTGVVNPWDEITDCKFTDNFTGWQTKSFTISSCGGTANLTRVRRIMLGNQTGISYPAGTALTWYVDRVVVSQ